MAEEQPAPTDATRPISVSIGKSGFQFPANYLLHSSARRGGEMEQIALIAMLPNFAGYTLGTAQEFTANAPDSRAVHIGLKNGGPVLSERERIERIYKKQAQNPAGEPGPFGLWQYGFPPESGYHAQDVLVGMTDTGPAVLLCTKLATDVPSPNCLRDTPLGNGLSLSYRFKRAHLAQWRTIDSGVRALIAGLAEKH